MIKSLRVDHRLLHGQVAFSWTSHLGADCILLASDSLLNDELRLTTVKIARPPGIRLVAKNIDDSIQAIKSGVTDKYKLFIVTDTIEDAARIARECQVRTINLGGTKSAKDKEKLSKAIYVTEHEKEVLRELIQEGIELNIQMIPSEKRISAESVL
ncbi:MAG: PTS sugar transporter subunit IIB [Lachnospiraceae bacterium]|jgi:fructoselysine and glucoselysine-specific PTS system IIB component|nr:PTS sugar transporter subunit IIB [Lachnospiraceae bacterium]